MDKEIIRVDQKLTNCTIKNEKGVECAGHLKEYMTAPPNLNQSLIAGYKLYRCKRCQAIYLAVNQEHLHSTKDSSTLPPQTTA